MRVSNTGAAPVYDRVFLLSAVKRNEILTLEEVRAYGRDSFGDPGYVCLYGLEPADWYARGVRVLARTAVECTRDELADLIGADVASIARSAGNSAGVLIVDPFAGSANTLHWLQRHLDADRGVGFELDDGVYGLTRGNLAILNSKIELVHGDYAAGLAALDVPNDCLLVAFVAPPWGEALSEAGLDLRATRPPAAEVVGVVSRAVAGHRLLFATQLYERLESKSVSDLTDHFDWSTMRMYDVDPPGRNHGVLLATKGWRPEV
jgi:hypothetical protein